MTGTFVNASAILLGSLIGILIHSRLPRPLIGIIFQGIGLVTLAIGVSMALKSDRFVIAVLSVAGGAVIGELLALEKRFNAFSETVRKKTRSESDKFTEGFITASLLFCVGSLSILGPIEEGMGHPPQLLYTKSVIDGISAAALAASFGIGVLFSAFPVLIYQGAITLSAFFMVRFMSPEMIGALTSVGGILLIGLGINILEIKKINVTNMLPALVLVVILSYFWG